MPANLPPQYYEAEKLYRLAKSPQEKIEALEVMLSIMPKHKGTDKLRAELRRRIAKFSEEAQRRPSIARKGSAYNIRKEGAGQLVLVGLPNAGKSQLVSTLTEAYPEVANYPYTTQTPTPGMLKFENIQIQLLDMPPITDPDAKPWFSQLLRNADLLLIVTDLGDNPLSQVETMLAELEKIRIKPVRRETGEEPLPGMPGMIQKRALIIGSKSDLNYSGQNYARLKSQYDDQFPVVSTSAKNGKGLEEMKRDIYKALDIIRVYTKSAGKKPDFEEPVVLKKGSTVEDVAESIHKDFGHSLKYAQVWGSGKYDGQRVKRGHILEDGDIVELHA